MSDRDWNVICDRTGFKVKASQTVLQWDGLRVLKSVVDRRNPQDFLRGFPDNQAVPWTRPETDDVFIDLVTPEDL